MDVGTLTQLVSSIGFPICMCGALFWYINKQTEMHREESEKTVEAINRLELNITKLIAQISTGKESMNE